MIASAPANSADPELVRVLRLYNDVTDRLKQSHEALAAEVCRLREELNEKNRELLRHERLAALGQMAAGVAHEIRNPLGGIGLYASLLDRDLAHAPQQRRLVRKISDGVENVEGIVRDILAFAGGSAPRMQVVEIGRVIEGAVAAAAPTLHSRAVQIEIDAGRDTKVNCDPGQIERAVLNLLLNAIDAAGTGGHVWVDLADARGTEYAVSIIVEDDGPGIPSDQLHRIFDPFFTTKETGTGLGLSIVHRIADEHGGRITAGNSDRGGARMVLTLPASAPK